MRACWTTLGSCMHVRIDVWVRCSVSCERCHEAIPANPNPEQLQYITKPQHCTPCIAVRVYVCGVTVCLKKFRSWIFQYCCGSRWRVTA